MVECHAAVIIDDHISCAEIDQWEGGGVKKSLHSGEYCRETKLLLKWTV